jgi:hypothetical protein
MAKSNFDANITDTPDDLPSMLALDYHVRFCFAANLLPLLTAAPAARVISVLSPGKEQKISEDDIELKSGYSLFKSKFHGAMLTSMAITELADQYPKMAWIHTFPGVVYTPFYDNIPGVIGFLMRWIVNPLFWPFSTSIEEVSQRTVYAATATEFSHGVFRLGATGNSEPESSAMAEYKQENKQSVFWAHTLKVFEKAGAI